MGENHIVDLEGVNVEWVKTQLNEYVQTTAMARSGNGARDFSPACGRSEAVRQTEIVRPILDRLSPNWRRGPLYASFDDFKRERDEASRVLARLDSHAEVTLNLGGTDTSPSVKASGMHPLIWESARAQWSTGHLHEAVLAAAKVVNSHLQAKVGRRDVSETDLIRQALSEKPPEPGKPRLRFPLSPDDQTRESMRQGVMNFGSGCFGAIRNPVGHLPNNDVDLPEHVALEQLAALSLLMRWIDAATVEDVSGSQ